MSEQTTCEWVFDAEIECWNTACGQQFVLIEGGPEVNNFYYCPYCGEEISQDTPK